MSNEVSAVPPEHCVQVCGHDLQALDRFVQVDEAVADDGEQPVVAQHLLAQHLRSQGGGEGSREAACTRQMGMRNGLKLWMRRRR